MKRFYLVLFIFILSPLRLFGQPFKHRALEKYPEGIGYIPIEDVFEEIKQIPEELKKKVDQFLSKNPKLENRYSLPKCTNRKELLENYDRYLVPSTMGNKSKENITLFIDDKKSALLRIGSFMTRLRKNVSSNGNDPYQVKWAFDEKHMTNASTFPVTLSHTSIPIWERLLVKAKSKYFEAVPSYYYHIKGRPTDLNDDNYLVIQEALPGKYKLFKDLSDEQKRQALKYVELDEVYRVLKYTSFAFPSDDNLWIDTNALAEKQTVIAITDGESPDNEGVGQNCKYGMAMLGQDLGKAKHNFKGEGCGHDVFANVINSANTQAEKIPTKFNKKLALAYWKQLKSEEKS